ncbi:hypothetical protein [Haloparvum sp. PAK95]|uniref:hypothetical protein n=1 Tax=Haloparvum sp. PAK95 TaxID=3418962 RepID=UPI003D2F0B1F
MPSDNRFLEVLYNIYEETNWPKELTLIILGSILGGLIFTAISPIVVPVIHDAQVNHFGVQNPTLGVEVEYAEDVESSTFNVSDQESYDRYRVIIRNPSSRRLTTVTIGLAFLGGIEAQEVGHYQVTDASSYSANARLAVQNHVENTTHITNAIRISHLPPGKVVTATFLIDRSPEERVLPGYWETSGLQNYNASKGTVMVSGQFRWNFKGSIYTENEGFTHINASKRASPYRFDNCIGEQSPEICAN